MKSNAKRSTSVPYHHGDLRRDLLRVARDAIARDGAGGVTLTSLASLVGVSQAAPYRHFVDKHALLEAVAAAGFDELIALLDGATLAKRPEERLLSIARAYVAFGEANVEIYRLMFASRVIPEAVPGSALGTAADVAFDRLRDAVSAMTETKLVTERALLVWAQLHGLVMLGADGLIDRRPSSFVSAANLMMMVKTKRADRTISKRAG